MKKREAVWDPLANVGKAVDTLLDAPSQRHTVSKGKLQRNDKSKGGRPSVEGRQRIVIYLDEKQVYNLKRRALDAKKDVSTLAREIFKQAGF